MATSNNAPQPTPAAAAAQTFDDTIEPAPPTIASDGGVGPNNIEAPIHAGSMNTLDSKYYSHWMSLQSIEWDTTKPAGYCLWKTYIHPDYSHQWLAWDAKKFNVWAGGFDYSVKVAGTGFHAGALLVVRLPPNIPPESIRSINDATCYDWKLIDPKTLEVVSQGVMDQRNIMYHYFPLNINDPNTFGGYFAIFVLLPLNTSSTGATQISIQIFTRPSQNLTMDQLRAIRVNDPALTNPVGLESALDFRHFKTSPLVQTALTGLTAWTKKSLAEVDFQTINCFKFDGKLLNLTYMPRFENIAWFEFNSNNKRLSDFGSSDFAYKVVSSGSEATNRLQFLANPKLFLSKLAYYPNNFDEIYPNFGETTGTLYMDFGKYPTPTTYPKNRIFAFPCKIVKLTPDEIGKGYTCSIEPVDVFKDGTSTGFTYDFGYPENAFPWFNGALDAPNNKQFLHRIGLVLDKIVFDTTYTKYAPPINESIITFQSSGGDVVAPYELEEILKSGIYNNVISPNSSFVFELWDHIAMLPLLPVRLSYNGILTTLSQNADRIFSFAAPMRYYFKYIGIIPTTTALNKATGLQPSETYASNIALSRFHNLQSRLLTIF